MQPIGINPGLVRSLVSSAPELLSELLTPGRTLEADVVSVFQDRAVLAMGRGVRLEVTAQAPLKEGQHVRVQVQPREFQPGTGTAAGQQGPIILKLMTAGEQAQPMQVRQVLTGPQPGASGEAAAGAQAGQSAQTGQAAGASSLAAQLTETLTDQPQGQAAQAQPGMPQVMWLPIPLPGGNGQAFAQLVIQEEERRKARAGGGQQAPRVHQVRLWWETPGLGPVQVNLEAAGPALAALFTVARPETRAAVETALPDLQEQLVRIGFEEARVAARPPAPGEAVDPVRVSDSTLLDRRM